MKFAVASVIRTDVVGVVSRSCAPRNVVRCCGHPVPRSERLSCNRMCDTEARA